MKIGLYSPYIPKHFGGGETYFLTLASVLSELGHEVIVGYPADTLSDQEKIRTQYQDFLGLSLEKVSFLPTPLGTTAGWFKKLRWTSQFDVFFFLTDGSFFFSLARRNIVHIQVPFTDAKVHPLDRLKLMNWPIRNTNSLFTKRVIERHWRINVPYVHYPLVELKTLSPQEIQTVKKERVILHVGRFFRQLHSKRQDVLVEIFRQLRTEEPKLTKDWQLVLIGGVEDQAYADEVKKMAADLPVKIIHELSRKELERWYACATVYWHATGFDDDEQRHPERMEHFGISTVEAMLAGAVPIVIGKGGQREAVGNELQDYTWQTMTECVRRTALVLENAPLRKKLVGIAQAQAAHFGRTAFTQTIEKMLTATL